ncbi:Crp/Fnr family transcriptional regulator [Aquimarina pacifica]|uniref:Crp/Fnr family transcriptional regulator n=1 Tax=Aquimarina pacifica TaxID=1296415 RepID=UPI0004715679|nr:Crp/Fnr family transcriptional regulator [Aquimarina pacifica]
MKNIESLQKFIQHINPMEVIDVDKITSTFRPIVIKKGDFLLKENDISDDYLYLESGVMRTFVYDLEGDEITTDIFTQNSIVFEITSFFNRVRSEANIQAVTDCFGYRISYQELNTLFHDKPAFRDFGRAILVKEFIASKRRNYAMINQTAERRYKNLVGQRPEIIKHTPLKYVASYLGITDSTLSRIRKNIGN